MGNQIVAGIRGFFGRFSSKSNSYDVATHNSDVSNNLGVEQSDGISETPKSDGAQVSNEHMNTSGAALGTAESKGSDRHDEDLGLSTPTVDELHDNQADEIPREDGSQKEHINEDNSQSEYMEAVDPQDSRQEKSTNESICDSNAIEVKDALDDKSVEDVQPQDYPCGISADIENDVTDDNATQDEEALTKEQLEVQPQNYPCGESAGLETNVIQGVRPHDYPCGISTENESCLIDDNITQYMDAENGEVEEVQPQDDPCSKSAENESYLIEDNISQDKDAECEEVEEVHPQAYPCSVPAESEIDFTEDNITQHEDAKGEIVEEVQSQDDLCYISAENESFITEDHTTEDKDAEGEKVEEVQSQDYTSSKSAGSESFFTEDNITQDEEAEGAKVGEVQPQDYPCSIPAESESYITEDNINEDEYAEGEKVEEVHSQDYTSSKFAENESYLSEDNITHHEDAKGEKVEEIQFQDYPCGKSPENESYLTADNVTQDSDAEGDEVEEVNSQDYLCGISAENDSNFSEDNITQNKDTESSEVEEVQPRDEESLTEEQGEDILSQNDSFGKPADLESYITDSNVSPRLDSVNEDEIKDQQLAVDQDIVYESNTDIAVPSELCTFTEQNDTNLVLLTRDEKLHDANVLSELQDEDIEDDDKIQSSSGMGEDVTESHTEGVSSDGLDLKSGYDPAVQGAQYEDRFYNNKAFQDKTVDPTNAEQQEAALKIQTKQRQHAAKVKTEEKRQDAAATKIQSKVRGDSDRKSSEYNTSTVDVDLDDPDVQEAATKIQAGFRGFKARKDVAEQDESSNARPAHTNTVQDDENEAASKIQASFKNSRDRNSSRNAMTSSDIQHDIINLDNDDILTDQDRLMQEDGLMLAAPNDDIFEQELALGFEDDDLADDESSENFEAQQHAAATKIQAHIRGHLIRKRRADWSSNLSRRLSKSDEGLLSVSDRDGDDSHRLRSLSVGSAATKIQALVRGHKARQDVKVLKVKNKQPEVLLRSDFDMQQADAAAVKIQALIRGKQQRKFVKLLKVKRLEVKKDVQLSNDSLTDDKTEHELFPARNHSEDTSDSINVNVGGERKPMIIASPESSDVDCSFSESDPQTGSSLDIVDTENDTDLNCLFTQKNMEALKTGEQKTDDDQTDDDILNVYQMNERRYSADTAATKIQAAVRGYKARKNMRRQITQDSCKSTNGSKSKRKHSRKASPGRRFSENTAATKIQAMVRGHDTRQKLKKRDASQRKQDKEQCALGKEMSGVEVKQRSFNPDVAATKIQAAFRGTQARKDVKLRRVKQHHDVMSLHGAMWDRTHHDAARKIQAIVRGQRARKHVKVVRSRMLNKARKANEADDNAADDAEQEIDLTDKDLEQAATKIQAGYRGFVTRRQLKPDETRELPAETATSNQPEADLDLNDPELEKAATKIQASFRGYTTRKEMSSAKDSEVNTKDDEALDELKESEKSDDKKNEQEGGDVDIDLDDPEVQMAAMKIQAGYKGFKVRQDIKLTKEAQVETGSDPVEEDSPPQNVMPGDDPETAVDIDRTDPDVEQDATNIQAGFKVEDTQEQDGDMDDVLCAEEEEKEAEEEADQEMEEEEQEMPEEKQEMQEEEQEVEDAEQDVEDAEQDVENAEQVEKAEHDVEEEERTVEKEEVEEGEKEQEEANEEEDNKASYLGQDTNVLDTTEANEVGEIGQDVDDSADQDDVIGQEVGQDDDAGKYDVDEEIHGQEYNTDEELVEKMGQQDENKLDLDEAPVEVTEEVGQEMDAEDEADGEVDATGDHRIGSGRVEQDADDKS